MKKKRKDILSRPIYRPEPTCSDPPGSPKVEHEVGAAPRIMRRGRHTTAGGIAGREKTYPMKTGSPEISLKFNELLLLITNRAPGRLRSKALRWLAQTSPVRIPPAQLFFRMRMLVESCFSPPLSDKQFFQLLMEAEARCIEALPSFQTDKAVSVSAAARLLRVSVKSLESWISIFHALEPDENGRVALGDVCDFLRGPFNVFMRIR